MSISLVTYNVSSQVPDWPNFVSTIGGILFTAYMGWRVYLKKERNSRILENITDFNIIFSYVTLNLEYIIPIMVHANNSIIEIEEFITNLEQMKSLMDMKAGKVPFDILLYLPKNTKQMYIEKQLKNIETRMVIYEALMQIIGKIQINDYNKNSVFITRFGNIYFHKLFLSLQSYYSKINELISIINKIIDEKSQGNYKEQMIPLFDEKNYESDINEKIQFFEYFKGMYTNLQNCLEGSIFYTDLILIHLESFNNQYSKKYKGIFNSLDIDFRELVISKNYDVKSLKYYKDNYDMYKEYAKSPKYHFFRSNPVKIYFKIIWKKVMHRIQKCFNR